MAKQSTTGQPPQGRQPSPDPGPPPAGQRRGGAAASDQADGATGATDTKDQRDDREGATEEQIGDRTGPAAGYDQEPKQEKDEGGVS